MQIPDDYANGTCQMGKGAQTCAYLTVTGDGWQCAKTVDMVGIKMSIDKRLQEGTMTAQGDNCDGYGNSGLPVLG